MLEVDPNLLRVVFNLFAFIPLGLALLWLVQTVSFVFAWMIGRWNLR